MRHLEDGSRRLLLAKRSQAHETLLNDPQAAAYFASLARVYLGTMLLSASAKHYLGASAGRELLKLTTQAELTWDASNGAPAGMLGWFTTGACKL